MSDQIENRVIDAKSRGIYEAPGMALLHIAYERLLSRDPQREHARSVLHARPPARPPALRRASGSTPRRCCSRTRSRAGSRRASPARSTLELRRGDDYSILDTQRRVHDLRPREALDGEGRRRRVHARGPHRRARDADAVASPTTARCCCTTSTASRASASGEEAARRAAREPQEALTAARRPEAPRSAWTVEARPDCTIRCNHLA